MVNSEQVARRLLDSISEPINFDPDRLARVAGQVFFFLLGAELGQRQHVARLRDRRAGLRDDDM